MPDIRIDKVTFTYAGASEPVLHTLDLVIPEGEFVLLTGPSGCGKSTLALALAGLIPSRVAGHLRGSVYFGADTVSTMDIHKASQHIGIVFQNPDNQLVQQTVEEEAAFGPENLALPQAEIAQRVEESLAYTGMQGMRYEQIYALSGGQKQRIAISATLAMRPKVLVLDEPTSDLDPLGTREVLNVLRMLNKQYGMTIVLVEHKVDEVIPWVDRVLLMDRGRIVVDGPPHNAFSDLSSWSTLGVSIPQMVALASALPEVFQGALPVSVEEALAALRNTHYAKMLVQHSQYEPEVRKSTVTQPILNWERVGLAYGARQVLRDIHLEILPEEWVAIIGPNGSGKTSLASLAMGFQAPSHGTIRFKDRIIKPGNISRQAENTAYLFQAADNMLFGATVEKEFLFGLQQAGRTLSGVLAALLLLFTTTPSEVVWAFYKFRLPPAAGLAFSAALRFLPQMMERMTMLLQVMQVRGYDLTIPRWWEVRKWPGYLGRVFACIPIITIPLLIGSLRTTSVMAMVVDARAFGTNPRRTNLREHAITLADRIALGLLIGLTLLVILLLVFNIGNRPI